MYVFYVIGFCLQVFGMCSTSLRYPVVAAAGSSSALVAVTGLCVFLAVAATVFGVLAWRGRKRLAVHYKEFT